MSKQATYSEHVYQEYARGMHVEPIHQRERIVRCRDCKHFTANEEFWIEPPQVPFPMIGATSDNCDFWAGTKCKVDPDGFCAWGEHKEVSA